MERSDFVEKKRDSFRKEYTSVVFNSYLNILLVLLIFSTSLLYAGSRIDWGPQSAVLIALAFLYGEAALYLAHRHQQHTKIKFQERIFEMHANWHHGMFSNERMHVDSIRDMNMVILPFFIHGFVLGVIYLPIGFLVERYLNSDIGWILAFGITLHLLWYEVVHTLSHLKSPPVLKNLTRHHREHHNPKLMGRYNFGIATTLFDRVFGTRFQGWPRDTKS